MCRKICVFSSHDDVIKFNNFPRSWPLVTHKRQWRGALRFSMICAWINGWVNNREAGDLRCHCAHYDVIVMVRARVLFSNWHYHGTYFNRKSRAPSLNNDCPERYGDSHYKDETAVRPSYLYGGILTVVRRHHYILMQHSSSSWSDDIVVDWQLTWNNVFKKWCTISLSIETTRMGVAIRLPGFFTFFWNLFGEDQYRRWCCVTITISPTNQYISCCFYQMPAFLYNI